MSLEEPRYDEGGKEKHHICTKWPERAKSRVYLISQYCKATVDTATDRHEGGEARHTKATLSRFLRAHWSVLGATSCHRPVEKKSAVHFQFLFGFWGSEEAYARSSQKIVLCTYLVWDAMRR